MSKEFIDYISEAERILILSHMAPDPDAVCSALLLSETIKLNYPDKSVIANIESKELPTNLSHLTGIDNISTKNVAEVVTGYKPDLLVLLDANNIERATNSNVEAIRDFIVKDQVKVVIIDHHERNGQEDSDLFIHRGSPAATQDVYELCFIDNELQKPDGYVDIAMTGLIADTGGFKYDNKRHRDTDKIKADLIDAGARIDYLTNKIEQFTKDQVIIIGNLCSNLQVDQDGFSYSYVSDEQSKRWADQGLSANEYKNACRSFVDIYIRNVEHNDWGFVVSKDLEAEDSTYSVSLRAVSGSKNVQQIAKHFGGGGHIPAAGFKIKADSAEAAAETILQYIRK